MNVVLPIVLLACAAAVWHGYRRRRALEEELKTLRETARVDTPSALRNRLAFREDLEIELARASRTGRATCLIVLSVEALADDGGVAELPVRRLTEAVATTMRAADVPYRIGVGEFAVVLPETRADGAALAADRLAHELLGRDALPARLRAGIAELGPGIDRRELFRHAYCAFLASGRDGRPDVVIYRPELESGASSDGGARDQIEA
jgi:diguanylate cyclase (GGDEF)-like protein